MHRVELVLQPLAQQLCRSLGATGVLVTQITKLSQVILTNTGLMLPENMKHEMPLRYSICQHVVGMDYLLVIDNALTHPLIQYASGIRELGIGAYLGAPIHDETGTPFVAVCAVQAIPRRWSEEDIAAVLRAAQDAERIINSALRTQSGYKINMD